MRLFRIVIILFLMQQCQAAWAQKAASNVPDALVKKFEFYSFKNQNDGLFVHFDKNVYTINENAWFTAYLLNDGTGNRNDVLSISLVNDANGAILLRSKFKMDKGVASGSVFLHDTIAPGNYSFMVYTNIMKNGEPKNVFTQQITIKGTAQSSYKASLFLQDTAKIAPLEGRKVLLMTQSSDSKFVMGAAVNYYLGNRQHPVMSGKVKTDGAGQYLFTIPNKNIVAEKNILHAEVIYNNEVKTIDITLPVQKNGPRVKFFPEGGSLSDGLESVVGLEIKNTEGAPYAVKGTLYKDDKQVDEIATNDYGMGKFSLTPSKGSNYYIKINTADAKDSVYHLPQVLANSPVITIANSLVTDTLKLVVKNKQPGKFYVLIHNYQQAFFSIPVTITANEKEIKIPLTDLPRGIAEATVLDSLERPYAERLFFAHYDKRDVLNVATDNSEYKTRQKVNLKLNLTGANGRPITGAVSIACVQANRLDINKSTDIESYYYLTNELQSLPKKQNYLGLAAADKAFLENTLLIKGWRKYTWAELMESTAKDTLKKQELLTFKGKVTDLGKSIKKELSFTLTRDSSRTTYMTDASGNFVLSDDDLFVRENEKIHLFANGNNKVEYFFDIDDPYVKTNEQLAAKYDPPANEYAIVSIQHDSQESIKGFEHSIQLKEVKIRGADTLMNACGDYICINGILNCPNHHHDAQNKIPVKGQTYYIFNPLTEAKKPFKYTGCNPDEDNAAKGFSGIHYGIEFYDTDYGQENTPATQYLSTIYWNHLYNLTSGKEADFSFYTSDVTGSFKIIVQGVTEADVIYGEKSFTVNK